MRSFDEKLYKENDRFGLFSVIAGIVSLVAWLIPMVGIIVSIAAAGFGLIALDSDSEKIAIGGIALSIIGFILTFLRSGLVYFMTV